MYIHAPPPRSTCTAGKCTYACTHPAVPSVGSHRADGKASPHVTRTGRRTKGTSVHGHGARDGVYVCTRKVPCPACKACIVHTNKQMADAACGLMHAPVNASAAGAALS